MEREVEATGIDAATGIDGLEAPTGIEAEERPKASCTWESKAGIYKREMRTLKIKSKTPWNIVNLDRSAC